VSPEDLRALYRRHETDVLRRHMARVRSPEVAADLTAETFAATLGSELDPSRETEAEWLQRLADRELAAAYRTGVVGDAARTRARIGAITLDRRSLDRVWQLRGPDRDPAPKPQVSEALVVVDRSAEVSDEPILPTVEAALLASARGRSGRSRTRRRVAITLRIAVAVVSVGWVAGQLLLPDRPSTATAYPTWLPFASGGVEGFYPRTWHLADARQAPAGRPELVAFTTFDTGSGTDPTCGALFVMSERDALVLVYERPDRPAVERITRDCAPDASLEWRESALIVLGPSAHRDDRAAAREIVDRLRTP
jgi:DNA-directed RNA polymerase specialized sigma24 family protein